MRDQQPGWQVLAKYDKPGRRGLWLRSTTVGADGELASFEVCAGREGDDAYVRFEMPPVGTPEHKQLWELHECLSRAAWNVRTFAGDSGVPGASDCRTCQCDACRALCEAVTRQVGAVDADAESGD